MNINEVTSALCDMYDIRRALSAKVKALPKDNDGTEYTIGECVNDVIAFLEQLESEMQ